VRQVRLPRHAHELDLGGGAERAERLGVADRTIFTGAANGVTQMLGMDFYVSASRYEAFSYALVEAAGRELPIVSTRVGGATAVVTDGVNGFLVAEDRMERFPQCMTALALDEGKRRAMASASLAAAERFTVERMAAETAEIYARLAENRPQ